jgi:uncharacterized DUF497 family protein
MLALDRIEGFQWDAGNAQKSEGKHRVSPAEAEQVFFNNPLVLDDVRHSSEEPRFHALGISDDGRLLHITFTIRESGRMIRVISARPMNRKERAYYDKEA